MGCGCCQIRKVPMGLGLSLPSGPTCFGQRTPSKPCVLAVCREVSNIVEYHRNDGSRRSTRFQSAKCAACHQCISRWKRPRHELHISPVSCGGMEPEQLTAVRYCERTIRRSSSLARGSSVASSSIAPPEVQNRGQYASEAAATLLPASRLLPCERPTAAPPDATLPGFAAGRVTSLSPRGTQSPSPAEMK